MPRTDLVAAPARAVPPSPMERVRRISRWVRGLALIGGALLVVLTAYLWTSTEWISGTLAAEAGVGQARLTITPAARWWSLALSMAPLAAGMFALVQVWHLFGEYGRGAIFTPAATMRLRRLAWAVMAVALAQMLARTAASVVLTMNNPPGQRMLTLSLSSNDYALLLFGMLLLAIAWVMVEATRLAQENAEFV